MWWKSRRNVGMGGGKKGGGEISGGKKDCEEIEWGCKETMMGKERENKWKYECRGNIKKVKRRMEKG